MIKARYENKARSSFINCPKCGDTGRVQSESVSYWCLCATGRHKARQDSTPEHICMGCNNFTTAKSGICQHCQRVNHDNPEKDPDFRPSKRATKGYV